MSSRADIAQHGMATLSIVEGFDVKENVRARLRTGFIDHMMHPFHFQAAKETLGWGIIVAVARAAHAHLKLMAL